MVSDLYLIAHVVNAVSYESAEVEFEVASPDPEGNWYDNDGHRLFPFWTTPIREELPAIPEGWIEYLHREAAKSVRKRGPAINSILSLLPKPPPGPTIRRRL